MRAGLDSSQWLKQESKGVRARDEEGHRAQRRRPARPGKGFAFSPQGPGEPRTRFGQGGWQGRLVWGGSVRLS